MAVRIQNIRGQGRPDLLTAIAPIDVVPERFMFRIDRGRGDGVLIVRIVVTWIGERDTEMDRLSFVDRCRGRSECAKGRLYIFYMRYEGQFDVIVARRWVVEFRLIREGAHVVVGHADSHRVVTVVGKRVCVMNEEGLRLVTGRADRAQGVVNVYVCNSVVVAPIDVSGGEILMR